MSGSRTCDSAAMDLEDLRVFTVLAELEHVTGAAATLRMPQSTLSRTLARLEAELGTPLFDRPGRRVRLNAYGRAFREHAQRALAEVDAGTRRVTSLRDPDGGCVRLGFVGSLGTWLVPLLLTHYRRHVTRTTIQLTAASSDVLADLLLGGRLDLVLLGPRPVHPDLDWVPLAEEQLCLSVPAGHRLAGRSSVALAEAAGEPFLSYQADTGMRQISDELCRAAGIDPAVTLESSDVATVDALVAAGMGVALRPGDRGGSRPPGVVHVPLAEARARREVGLARARHRTGPAAVTRFRELAIAAAAAERHP